MHKLGLNQFLDRITKHQLIIFGELHGTKEIPNLMKKVLSGLAKKIDIIFLELPKSQQKHIDNFFVSGNEKYLYLTPFFHRKLKDGRESKENLNLIKHIKSLRDKCNRELKIICVDPDNYSKRDYLMYKEIKKNLNSKNAVFITGNIHASKEKFMINKRPILTTGYYLQKYLKNKLLSVCFVANQGSYFNFSKKAISKRKEFKSGIYVLGNKNYDIYYVLNKVSSCSFLGY